MNLIESPRSASRNIDSKLCNTAIFPSPVVEALIAIGEAAIKSQLTVTLKGGIGSTLGAIMACDNLSLRPISLDVDLVCSHQPLQIAAHEALVSQLCGHKVTCVDGIETIGHLRFGSTIGRGNWRASDGSMVSIDLIPTCRFDPNGAGFCFAFGEHRAQTQLSSCSTKFHSQLTNLYINSLEITLLEKLALGRGPEMGKFDLIDAAVILGAIRLNSRILEQAIDSQIYSPAYDFPAVSVDSAEQLTRAKISALAYRIEVSLLTLNKNVPLPMGTSSNLYQANLQALSGIIARRK